MESAPVSVSAEQFMWFVDNALDQMMVALRELDDDLANTRPDIEGANSPYAIVTHCLGVMEFWGGASIAARRIVRDREAEFVATGAISDLLAKVSTARQQLEEDIVLLDASPPAITGGDELAPYRNDKSAVLLHVLEELYQHLGQLELTRDVLLSEQ